MRFVVGVLVCMGAGAISLALADPSTTAPAATAPAAPVAAPSTTAPAPTAPAAPVAAATTPAATATAPTPATPGVDPEEKRLLAAGYRMQLRHGEKMFCRREEEIGSRLGGREVCRTKEQLRVTQESAKDAVIEAQRHQASPAH
ncbi:MAG TPA: hypothetical protein VGD47_12040 [Steroidobacteraceae bacterium]